MFGPLDSNGPIPTDVARQLQRLGYLLLLWLCYNLPTQVAFPSEEFANSLRGSISSPDIGHG